MAYAVTMAETPFSEEAVRTFWTPATASVTAGSIAAREAPGQAATDMTLRREAVTASHPFVRQGSAMEYPIPLSGLRGEMPKHASGELKEREDG